MSRKKDQIIAGLERKLRHFEFGIRQTERLLRTRLTFRQSPGGWRIGATVSSFLVAEGPGFSERFGSELFITLANGRPIDKSNDEWVVEKWRYGN